MGSLIDTSLWVDHFRPTTPAAVKDQVLACVNQKDIWVSEVIVFELLSSARKRDRARLEAYFEVIPGLPTPSDLWRDATRLGQECMDGGITVPAMDLVIASLCIHHGVPLTTFDSHFVSIAGVAPLKVECLKRAV
jgi:predicted nucleic acid-binding protein